MRRLLILGFTVALVGAACSSSKSTKSTTATTTAAGGAGATTGGSATTAGGTPAPAGAPIKIAFLDIETGTFAAPDRHNALQLAIDQINANGGVLGHKIQYTAYDTGILPQQTITAVTKAISDKPTVMLGLEVSSGVQAAGPTIKQSGIPTLQEASDNTTDLSRLGVSNMFRISDTAKEEGEATGKYIASTHPTTVGLWDDSDTNGKVITSNVQAQLQAAGITKFVKRESPQGATDTTEAALAMKNVDILETNGFPQTDALFVKQLYQNGVTAPNVLTYADEDIQAFGLAPQAALAHDVYQSNCDPDAVHSAQADAFTAAYKARYGASVTETATATPVFYDAVYMIAAAVKATNGDLSPSAIIGAMKALSYTGACGTFKADAENNMAHSAWIVSLADNTKTLVTAYENMTSS